MKPTLATILILMFFSVTAVSARGETTTQTVQQLSPTTETAAARRISLFDAFALPLQLSDILTTMARPREQPTTPTVAVVTPEMMKAEFDRAFSLIQRGREREAKAALESFVAKYPNSSYVPQARYQVGLLETDVPRAIGEFQSLLAQYPTSSWAPLALWKIAELHFLLGNYKDAIEYYKRYLTEYPQGQFVDLAQLQTAYALIKLNDFGSAIPILSELGARYPRYRFKPEVPDALAECYINTGEISKSIEQLQYILRDFPNYPFIAKIYLNLALCLEDTGDVTKASSIYADITQRFPRSSEAILAQLCLTDIASTTTLTRKQNR